MNEAFQSEEELTIDPYVILRWLADRRYIKCYKRGITYIPEFEGRDKVLGPSAADGDGVGNVNETIPEGDEDQVQDGENSKGSPVSSYDDPSAEQHSGHSGSGVAGDSRLGSKNGMEKDQYLINEEEFKNSVPKDLFDLLERNGGTCSEGELGWLYRICDYDADEVRKRVQEKDAIREDPFVVHAELKRINDFNDFAYTNYLPSFENLAAVVGENLSYKRLEIADQLSSTPVPYVHFVCE